MLKQNKIKFTKFVIPKPVLVFIVLALVLNIGRVILFGSYSLIYIIWNMFLAFLPFVLSYVLLHYKSSDKFNKIVFCLGLLLWFLLFPNTIYIVTDMIHVGHYKGIPVVYDSFLLFSSAYLGVMLGVYSLSHIEDIFIKKYSKFKVNLIILFVILSSSFGIYIGRFLRFNSWDIASNPFSFFVNIVQDFSRPNGFSDVSFYVILFSVFTYAAFYSFKYMKINDTNK